MKIYRTLIFSLFFSALLSAQGLYNNGAHIVMNGAASNIYIDGATGNYTSTNGGLVDPLVNGPRVTLLGNWINNSANVGFGFDGSNVVFAGANQSIGGTHFTHFYNVTLSGSGTKTLNIQTRVGGFGGFPNGILSIGSRVLDLNGFDLWQFNPANASITNSTGYIQSETNVALNPSQVKWFVGMNTGTYTVPFGLAATQIPLDINITTGMSSAFSYFISSTRATSTSNNTPWSSTVTHMFDPNIGGDGSVQAVVDRWWDFTFSDVATATIDFRYRGSENTLIVPYNTGTLGAQYWANAWLPDNSNIGSGIAVLAGVGSVSAAGINFAAAAYTPMVLSSTSAPLPIELLNFNSSCNANAQVLQWSTASETNNHFFTIQRSDDGNNFHDIGNVNGSGSTSQQHNYSFTDTTPISGRSYYRLKQTDFNGQFATFQIIAAESCGANENTIDAFSGDDGIHLLINSSSENNYSVSIFDATGRMISKENISAAIGASQFLFNGIIPAKGIYLIEVIGNDGTSFTKKLLISKD